MICLIDSKYVSKISDSNRIKSEIKCTMIDRDHDTIESLQNMSCESIV